MKTLLISVEGGEASVAHKIGENLQVEKAATFSKIEDVFWRLQRGELQPEITVIDTITTWANTTRQDVVIDPDLLAGKSLWANREKVIPAQRDWGVMTDLVARLLRMFYQLPGIIVLVSHQGEKDDPLTGEEKLAPALNPALLHEIVAFSDVIGHLGIITKDVETESGVVRAGTRRLRLVADSRHMAKARVAPTVEVPAVLLNPTLPELLAVGKAAGTEWKKIVIYGPPGVGKTTLACSGVNEKEEGN